MNKISIVLVIAIAFGLVIVGGIGMTTTAVGVSYGDLVGGPMIESVSAHHCPPPPPPEPDPCHNN